MVKTLKRNIGLHHVVFFRACMEDPDELHTAALANRYLETGTNLHEANKVLRMVQDALTQVARRQGRHGAARLLSLPRGRLRVTAQQIEANAAPVETFEDFQAQYDPDGAFGYQELLEIYEAEHGAQGASMAQTPTRSERETKRAVRLLEKKIRVINDLSLEIIRDPQPEDWVIGWFAEKVSNRLEAAGIRTLQDIIDYANFHGYRWWTRIPGIGKLTGDRIMEWLAQQNFPVPPSDYALIPRRKLDKRAVTLAREAVKQMAGRRNQAAGQGGAVGLLSGPTGPKTGMPVARLNSIAEIADSLVEIDREGARLAFDGRSGRNRAPADRCRLDGVQTDMEAVQAWLSLHTGQTLKSYRREAERFMLWALYERHKSMSDLDTTDVAAYASFLISPSPVEKWVADKRYERGHPGWRPFVKKKATDQAGLSRLSVAHAIGVLSQMCKWLVGQRYLDSNPFDGLPRMNVANIRPELGTGKSLSQKAWELLRTSTELLAKERATDATYRRGWLALMLGVGTGMRISELTAATVGQLQAIDTDSSVPAWCLQVTGKGQKQRLVPLPLKVFEILEDDLRARGYQFQSVLDLDGRIPLLARLEAYDAGLEAGLEPLSVDAIRDIYQQVFDRAADFIELEEPHIAARLRKASPHQLRHTYASMGVKKMQLKHVQDNLGHASISTTSIYLHADQSERFEDTNQFFEDLG